MEKLMWVLVSSSIAISELLHNVLKRKNKKIKLEKRSSAVPNIWYKNKETDTIWWKDDPTVIGVWIFSFDKTTEFNMLHDYPYKLTKKQKQIFDKENPEWADFFKDRK